MVDLFPFKELLIKGKKKTKFIGADTQPLSFIYRQLYS